MSPEEQEAYYKEVSKHNGANTSEWIGAIFRYVLCFGKRKFTSLYTAQEYRKNTIAGTIIKIVLFLSFFAIMMMMYS